MKTNKTAKIKSTNSKKENLFTRVSNYIKDSIQTATLRQPVEKALKEIDIKKEVLIYIFLSLAILLIGFVTEYSTLSQNPFIVNGEDSTLIIILILYTLVTIFTAAYYIFSIIELHIFSKLVGGQGLFVKTFGSIAKIANSIIITFFLPIQILFSAIVLMSTITQINSIIMPIADLVRLILFIIVFLVNVILTIKTTKVLYKLDTLRAILSSIIFPIILEILLLIALIIGLVIIGMILGVATTY